MRRHTRENLEGMSLKGLKKRRQELEVALASTDEVIAGIEELDEPRDVDVATSFEGDEGLVAEILSISGDTKTDKWTQAQTLYCSKKRCKSCPHGPFVFAYRRLKSGAIRVKYKGKPVFNLRTLAEMAKHCRPGWRGKIVTVEE